jgi:hypothetical protein
MMKYKTSLDSKNEGSMVLLSVSSHWRGVDNHCRCEFVDLIIIVLRDSVLEKDINAL